MSDKIETVEAEEPETDTTELAETKEMTSDGMDAVIAVASKMDAFSKAMDTILNHVIKRSYIGDWVCHAKEGAKQEDMKANIGSAAAERIASFLGIQEKNWTPGLKVKSDDGQFFTWQFEADFGFGKRWIHAIGRASSKDKFFGFANGQWKDLEDVKEDDIRMAAFRNTRKEGVRGLLGLRSIPLAKLQELGFNTANVRMAGFTAKMSAEDKGKAASDGLIYKEIKVVSIAKKSESKDPKKPWTLWTITDGKLEYGMFSAPDGKRLTLLTLRQEDQLPVKVGVKVGSYNNKEQYSIERVEGAEEESK